MNKYLLLIALTFLSFNISCKKNSTSSENKAPIASFTITPTSGTTTTSFTFDASGSIDKEDETIALQVRWDWNNDGIYNTDFSTTKTATHKYDDEGNYIIELEVKDGGGLTHKTTKQLIVSSANTAPTASFTVNPTSGTTATVFNFDGSGSTDNEDATAVLQVRWDWNNDGTYDTNYTTTKTTTHQFSTEGNYTVKLEIKDSEGLTNTTTNAVSIQQPNIIVTFPDANFEELIRESLNIPIGNIMNTDLMTITTLSGSDRGITNISGIEYCTSLENLFLEKNSISDISALSGLIKLKILKLYNNFAIVDISALENLIDLEQLFLTHNLITDLTPISGLNNLTLLLIGGNPLDDISIVSNLTQLQTLYLGNIHIGNINALSNLTNLIALDLNDTQITDLTPLTGMIHLERLWVCNNSLSNSSVLSNLINLDFLHIAHTQTTSINDIGGLTNLSSLYMFGNNITDITPLSNLSNLIHINMHSNMIVEISALQGLNKLESININDNSVIDILPLVNNTGIDDGDSIWLENNPLSGTSINTYIPQLEARGVDVTY